ncbi:hypothetical protein ARMSODRAFT_1023796 [Armillaria solidipes]|uniref:Family A G protein-coupled receptor-like protein n=1 Tax=Armillaria solidipes TaxID=1076256 RepID=A0A2H3B3Z0_9AGAR|nr:hypothetical protein ARMSODRAFT_1023796 [Armillaria solidipes]
MAAQAALLPDLTNDDIYLIISISDVKLNTTILQALLHGFYTGVLGVTLWTIFIVRSSTKNSSIGRYVMVFTIFILYMLATILFGENWASVHHAFIDEGQNCYTIFLDTNDFSPMLVRQYLMASITSCISTFIADSSLIWRCWIVWGHQWSIIIIPVLCTILNTVFKSIQTYYACTLTTNDIEDSAYNDSQGAKWKMSYTALTLTTTLWCTIFILYRIISVAGSGHGAGIRSYHRVIEALIESAALYSVVFIIDIVFVARNMLSGSYVDVLAAAIKGIAPTLLVGRVAAGHARPDDSWQEDNTSIVSSLNFGTGTVSTQDGDVSQSAELVEMDDLDSGLERNSMLIEEEAQEARSLNIV